MQHSLTTLAGLERRLEISLPDENVAAEVDKRLKGLMRTVKLKGFRPGKVPYAVVKAQYADQVHMEAVERLIQNSVSESIDELHLRPAARPRIEPIQMMPGAELKFAALFEVLPEIKLQPLDSLQYERPAATISDADVEQMIERMRQQRPKFSAIDRAAKATDRATIDYEGRIDGVVFPGGKGEGLQVVLGAGAILPELDQALHGMSAGESKSIAARFPDNYGSAAVAGKQALFDIKLNTVEEASTPPLDVEFVRAVGLPEGGVDELRAEVRKGLERELADTVQARARESLMDALYKSNPLELPKVLVDEQVMDIQQQMQQRLNRSWPEGKAPGRELFEESARKRVALGLIIGEIVRTNELKPDRQQVEARLRAATAGARDPDQLRRQYLQSREAMRQLEAGALEDAAISFVQSHAKVAEKPSNFAELSGGGHNAGNVA
jgi:trigger factor